MQQNKQLASATAVSSTEMSRRLFFFDEAGPDGARNVKHVYAPVEKLGVIMDVEKPWERAGVNSFCSTILRLDSGRLRLYYTARDNQGRMRIAVAESDNGLEWERLALGQDSRFGADSNVIWFEGVPSGPRNPDAPDVIVADDGAVIQGAAEHCQQDKVGQPQVWRRADGTWCMLFWFHRHGWGRPGYIYLYAESEDGLKWTVPDYDTPVLVPHFLHHDKPDIPDEQKMRERRLTTNDANFVYFNPWLKCYEQFSQWMLPAIPDRRVEVDNCKGMNRMIQRRASADGVNWSAPRLVIQADDKDPWDMQFYHMAAQYHEDWMIGSLGHYRVEDGQQTMDLELCFSRDGRTWERPVRGGFIPREPGGRDQEMVSPPNVWIDEGDTWLCLYTASARKHNEHARDDLPPGCISGARWAKNRFVGIAADSVPGGFLTEVFFPQQAELTIDAEIKGWLKAELCDAWGRKLDGFHLKDSDVMQGDSSAHVLRWNGKDAAGLEHLAARLRFEFSEGVIYGVGF